MKKRKVTIVSGLQITDNPRVVKEADALSEMGLGVEVLGAIHSPNSLKRINSLLDGRKWIHKPVIDRTSRSWIVGLRNGAVRVGSRIWREAAMRFGIENQRQLGEQTMVLSRVALESRADLYSLHVDASLWTGKVLADKGLPFSLDVEDWYSEDGLPADRVSRPLRLMKRLERQLLNAATYATTTSVSLASALAEEYGSAPLDVVYNSFPSDDRAKIDNLRLDRRNPSTPSIVWFSQTIGPGRGLEGLMDAAAQLTGEFEIHLRGTPRPGYLDTLMARCAKDLRRRVYTHPQVPQQELLSRLMEHDIGFCGELSDCRSRDLTVTNKILEYMRAGLAIVASDTAGQQEVAAKMPSAVSLFRQTDVGALAQSLRRLIESPERLQAAKRAAWSEFDGAFGWEHSKRRIQANVESFFARPARRTASTELSTRRS